MITYQNVIELRLYALSEAQSFPVKLRSSGEHSCWLSEPSNPEFLNQEASLGEPPSPLSEEA
jgi:hypothetical protein